MSAERQAFEAFAAKFCGVPYADLVRGETTGLVFAWECWQEAQRQGGKWDDRRAAQLEDLARLLNLCRKVNTSSGIIPALSSMEQLGDELSTSDLKAIYPSFLEFLNQLCRDDRRNQSNQETK